jgi:hypothetical protein
MSNQLMEKQSCYYKNIIKDDNTFNNHAFTPNQIYCLKYFFTNILKNIEYDNKNFCKNFISDIIPLSCGSFGCGIKISNGIKKFIVNIIGGNPKYVLNQVLNKNIIVANNIFSSIFDNNINNDNKYGVDNKLKNTSNVSNLNNNNEFEKYIKLINDEIINYCENSMKNFNCMYGNIILYYDYVSKQCKVYKCEFFDSKFNLNNINIDNLINKESIQLNDALFFFIY